MKFIVGEKYRSTANDFGVAYEYVGRVFDYRKSSSEQRQAFRMEPDVIYTLAPSKAAKIMRPVDSE